MLCNKIQFQTNTTTILIPPSLVKKIQNLVKHCNQAMFYFLKLFTNLICGNNSYFLVCKNNFFSLLKIVCKYEIYSFQKLLFI